MPDIDGQEDLGAGMHREFLSVPVGSIDGMRDVDLRLVQLVRNREGVFTRVEAVRLGFSPEMIEHRCVSGAWKQFDQDVFALAVFPGTWEQRCRAATSIHPAASLSHRTSAAWLGLDGFRAGQIHVTVPTVAHHGSRIATVHRSRHVQFSMVEGVRTTSFAQTVIQLAAQESRPSLLGAVSSGIHQRFQRLDDLHLRIGELRNRRLPGMSRLIDVLDEIDGEPPTESELERRLFSLVRFLPEVPDIERQVSMPWSPDRATIVDGFIGSWRLILEADGRRWHTRIQDFERDRWRDNEAAIHGLHVMRFTWHRLEHDPEGVLDQLRRFERARRSAARDHADSSRARDLRTSPHPSTSGATTVA